MVVTLSAMADLGSSAPDFSLVDTRNDSLVSLRDYADYPVYLVAFICNHCPYVLHIHDTFVALANAYIKQHGIACFAISANDATSYPADGPDKMRQKALSCGYEFPYLYDETQIVAKSYQAVCTPDFFVFDAKRVLVYRGQFDASRPADDIPVTGSCLRQALDDVLAGRMVDAAQVPSLGCNIKWKN